MEPGARMEKDDIVLDIKNDDTSTNFRNGLSDEEEESLHEVDCNTRADEIFENAKYFSTTVNYEVLYVICPPNCHKAASTIGRTIYNPKTSVCAAGIVDNSIPMSGGMFGIVRASGQAAYGDYKKVHGINCN